jgi:lysophospholipase L1-like esterase
MRKSRIGQKLIGKRVCILLILTCLSANQFAYPSSKKNKDHTRTILENKRVLFLGDSITQDGTYVSFIDYYLQSMFPRKKFDIISIGLSSETASGLTEPGSPFPRPCILTRVDRALKEIKPDIVTVCYGMNDGIYYPQSPKRFMAFKDGMLRLIIKLKAAVNKIIILTPPVFDPLRIPQKIQKDGAKSYRFSKPYYKYDNVLADYSRWIMNLHIKNVETIDLHTRMKQYLDRRQKVDPNLFINRDGVHPTPLGHLFMAQTFLNGIGIQIHPNNLEQELGKISADTLFKLVNKQRQLRSKGWLDYIGYTRGKTVKSDEIAPTEKQAAELQKQINVLRQNKN